MIAKENGMRIGILALQGDIQAHESVLERLGHNAREVRRADDLDDLHGIVLPGGESTTMWYFLRRTELDQALRRFLRAGGAAFGTCAGAILLAREVRNPDTRGLDGIDICIERNGYGRQTESRVVDAATDDPDAPSIEAVLIRAPRIVRVGSDVRVRAQLQEEPVWVESGRVIATTFHPELTRDTRVHRRFLDLARDSAKASVALDAR
jgi:5'-phosphate synthase pdxT subunit